MNGDVGRRIVTRRALLATSLFGVGALVAGCAAPAAPTPTAAPAAAAPPSAPAPAPTAAPAAAKAPAAAEKVTIKVFGRAHPTIDVAKGGADEYTAEHPNVTVDWQGAPAGEDLRKELVMAAAGSSPDIQWNCTPCDFKLYVVSGLYIDHLPLVKARNLDLTQFIQSAIDTGTVGGKLYGISNLAHPSYPAVIINKTMFEKGGVPIPKEEWTDGPHPGWKSWTYDALRDAAVALTKREGGRVQQWGFQMRGYANAMMVAIAGIRSEGGDYLDPEGRKLQFDTPEGRKVLGFYWDLTSKYNTTPLMADMPSGGPDLMASNRVAIRSAPIWAIGDAQSKFKDFEWQVLPAPLGAVGVDAFAEANFYSIMTSSKQREVAFDILAKMVEPKWGWKVVEMGGIPGTQKEFWAPGSKLFTHPGYTIFAKYMNTVSAARLPANARMAELLNTGNAAMDPVFIGQQLDQNQLVKDMSAKLQQILDRGAPTVQDLAKPSAAGACCTA
jgi:multiple sugar transport system substrate-binding protein